MKISILLGSIREGRQSHKIAYHLENRLSTINGIEPILLDLADYDLPMLNNRWKDQATLNKDLAEFGKIINESDALIFISPEYHGSYTGVLKNAIDHYWSEFKKKPIGVVATGSGQFGGINASTEIQQLILSLGAYPMPFKLLVPYIKNAFDEEYKPIELVLEKNVSKFIEEFLWFSRALVNATTSESISS